MGLSWAFEKELSLFCKASEVLAVLGLCRNQSIRISRAGSQHWLGCQTTLHCILRTKLFVVATGAMYGCFWTVMAVLFACLRIMLAGSVGRMDLIVTGNLRYICT